MGAGASIAGFNFARGVCRCFFSLSLSQTSGMFLAQDVNQEMRERERGHFGGPFKFNEFFARK